MNQVHLYIAMSLDGYLAAADGGVEWLAGQGEEGALDTYGGFLEGVDRVVMGWKTYHQIVTELSPEHWPYEGLTAYVVTHRPLPSSGGIRFTATPPAQLVRQLRQEPGKDIWICGGASLVSQLLEADLIDRLTITLIPTLLGSGLRLFPEGIPPLPLRLLSTAAGDGMVELQYARR